MIENFTDAPILGLALAEAGILHSAVNPLELLLTDWLILEIVELKVLPRAGIIDYHFGTLLPYFCSIVFRDINFYFLVRCC